LFLLLHYGATRAFYLTTDVAMVALPVRISFPIASFVWFLRSARCEEYNEAELYVFHDPNLMFFLGLL
jgi:hypothetical protein